MEAFLPEHKRTILESRLLPRLEALGLRSFMDYYLLLQYDSGRELPYLARTALPFFGLLVLAVFLIYLFPKTVLWLPGLIFVGVGIYR